MLPSAGLASDDKICAAGSSEPTAPIPPMFSEPAAEPERKEVEIASVSG